jgi:lactate dehydrogenase-like 2-hydroxyacid dehydrogenase
LCNCAREQNFCLFGLLSLHCPLASPSKRTVNGKSIASVKDDAIVINTAGSSTRR